MYLNFCSQPKKFFRYVIYIITVDVFKLQSALKITKNDTDSVTKNITLNDTKKVTKYVTNFVTFLLHILI